MHFRNFRKRGFTMDLISEILKVYHLEGEVSSYGDGHINDTYILTHKNYILQRINTDIFLDVDSLMENISGVTEYLRKELEKDGKNPDRETLTLVKTKDGKNYYRSEAGDAYRIYKFIDGAKSYNLAENPTQFCEAARAFGRFAMYLDKYPAESLHETIKDFHNTPFRYLQLDEAIKKDPLGRAKTVKEEIDFAMARRNEASKVTDAIKKGEVPLRVTHNDTKLNNVLIDDKTGCGLCVLDLDTVMPGSLLYDFGDALRFGASSAVEDETDLSKVWFDMDLYKAFVSGYLEETGKILTEAEKELLPFSAKLLTLECGIRFLSDYIMGDVYFKIHKENHNLDRARNQFKLVYDIEQKLPEMKKIVDEYFKK